MELKMGLVGKGFEAVDGESLEVHGVKEKAKPDLTIPNSEQPNEKCKNRKILCSPRV
jgi:hypothetical protein